jgi:hypothetical protein
MLSKEANEKLQEPLTAVADAASIHSTIPKDVTIPQEKVSITRLFQFADGWDLFFMTVGFLTSLANGATLPLMTVIFCTPPIRNSVV